MTDPTEPVLNPTEETLEAPPEDPMIALQAELNEMKDKYLRLLADQENLRKRLAKEKQEIVGFSIENTISEFLPAIDHFENALKFANNASDEVKKWSVGFQMILSQFRQVLQNNGICPFESVGKMFDPNYHDAVETEESSDVLEGTILEEFTKGYQSALRTIRPARVKVARAPQKDLSSEVESAPIENLNK